MSYIFLLQSHPAWVCGLKPVLNYCLNSGKTVTPCVGVWIETLRYLFQHPYWQSHPAWVCGLKQANLYFVIQNKKSHPAWVCGLKLTSYLSLKPRASHTLRGCVDWNNNIDKSGDMLLSHTLRGCVDWNRLILHYKALKAVSHPAWVCGLKPFRNLSFEKPHCHTLRGCVDWNSQRELNLLRRIVTPCVGVWIETSQCSL